MARTITKPALESRPPGIGRTVTTAPTWDLPRITRDTDQGVRALVFAGGRPVLAAGAWWAELDALVRAVPAVLAGARCHGGAAPAWVGSRAGIEPARVGRPGGMGNRREKGD